MSRWIALIGIALMVSLPAAGLEPEERMQDPALEERARALYQDLRCVVCQNQSLDDSPAQIAADMRAVVREQLRSGASNEAVRDFMVARYGDYVLLAPPVQPSTYALWLAPGVILLAGAVGVAWFLARRRQTPTPEPLSAEERTAIDRLLAEGKADGTGADKRAAEKREPGGRETDGRGS
jgi:cytochrome c-type biogenesis protein CcmH